MAAMNQCMLKFQKFKERAMVSSLSPNKTSESSGIVSSSTHHGSFYSQPPSLLLSEEMTKESVTGMGTDSSSDIDDEEDDMEQEEMFVAPDITLGTDKIEWGGPRRGGRRPEPTRFGDWERKGRCTDF